MIELRKRINQNLNKLVESFGAFSSIDKAIQYIKLEGRTTADDYEMKSGFFAIMEYDLDKIYWESGIAVGAYDFNGNKTNYFRNEVVN